MFFEFYTYTSSGVEIGEYGGGDEENERNSGSQFKTWCGEARSCADYYY